MADITPTLDSSVAGVPRVIWTGITQSDAGLPLVLRQQYGLAASVQTIGTFGSGTITMQVSNDGTNWATALSVFGSSVAMTAATQYFEMSLSAAYIRPVLTGGSSSDLDVILVLRGSNAL